jgi:hypothetical protein
LPEGSLEQETVILVLPLIPEKATGSEVLSLRSDHLPLEPTADGPVAAYRLSPEGLEARGTFSVEFAYDGIDLGSNVNPGQLSLELHGHGGLASVVDPHRKTIGAPLPRFGTVVFAIREPGASHLLESDEIFLSAIHPNPVRSLASIHLQAAHPAMVEVSVFDVMGREVGKPFAGSLSPGPNVVSWDASRLASGFYFMTVASDRARLSRKVLVIR